MHEERKQWDDSFIEFAELEKLSPEVSLVYYVVKPPIFFMKSRDLAEKAIRLTQDGNYYEYDSSIPNESYPEKSQYQRCETVFAGSMLTKEGDEYGYYSFSQLKVILIIM